MMCSHPVRVTQMHVRRAQQGVTMIVALVMLVVIGLMSASVMRNSLNADLIANNVRDQIQAEQAAQMALRYCEKQATTAGFVLTPPTWPNPLVPPATPVWSVFVNWKKSDPAWKATELPTSILKSSNSSIWPKNPQCMAENSVMNNGKGTPIIVVTARGFSPDYSEDSGGRTKTGSVVWLQSVIRVS